MEAGGDLDEVLKAWYTQKVDWVNERLFSLLKLRFCWSHVHETLFVLLGQAILLLIWG